MKFRSTAACILAALLAVFFSNPAYSSTTIVFNGSMKGVLGAAEDGYGVKINSVVEKLRIENPELLLLSPGNMLGPSPTSSVDGGATVIGLMNRCGYDGMAVGLHDLFAGTENLLRRAEEADFPFVASNLYPSPESALSSSLSTSRWSTIRQYLPVELGGKSVLVLGLISPALVQTWIGWPPELAVADPEETLEAYREEARRYDLVVLLGTMPLSMGGSLLEETPWIDMAILHVPGSTESLVDGGFFLERLDGRRLFWSRSRDRHMTSVTLDQGPERITWNARPYDVLEAETTDEESVRLVQKLEALAAEKHGDVLCRLTPYEQTHFHEALQEALRYECNAEIAIMHGYSLRDVPPPEELTAAAINSVYAYGDRVIRLDVPGKMLKDIWSLRSWCDMEGKSLIFTGMTEKQGQILVNGRPLDVNDTYRVATVEFLVAGSLNIFRGVPWQPGQQTLTDLLGGHFRDHADRDRIALYRANAGKPIIRARAGGEYAYNKLDFNKAATSYQYTDPQAAYRGSDIPGLVGFPYRQTNIRFNYHLQIDRPQSDITLGLNLNYSEFSEIKLMDKGTFVLGYEDKSSLGKRRKFASLNLTSTLKDPDVAGRKHPYFLRLSAGFRWDLNQFLNGYLGLANLMRSATVDQSPNAGLNAGCHFNRRLADRLTLDITLDCFASVDSDRIRTMDGTALLTFELTRHLSFRTRYTRFSWEDNLVGQRGYRDELFHGLGLTFKHRRF